MLLCRGCGQSVGTNGFCSICMTSIYVKNVDVNVKHKSEISGKLKFKCQFCNKKFKSKKSLNHHTEAKHNSMPDLPKTTSSSSKFECQFCNKKFQAKNSLKQHIKDKHKPIPDLPKTISSSSNVPILPLFYEKYEGNHIVFSSGKRYNKSKQILCHCGAKFVYLNDFEQHVKSYQHYTCYYCREKCDSHESFDIHIKKCANFRARNGNFECEFCNKKFKSSEGLDHHIREKHKEILSPKFECEFCNKNFKSKKKLYKHINTKHEKEYLKNLVVSYT